MILNPSGPPTFVQIQNPNAGALYHYAEDTTAGPDGNIWYTQQSFPAIVKLNVNGSPTPTLQSIAVTPANPSITVGTTQQFVATGTLSDNTTENLTSQVTWASATPSVATISTTGLASALATGTSSITPSLSGITGATTLTVTPTSTPTLLSITVTPANPSIAVGATQQFVATGTLSDNTTENLTSQVTWASATPSVATISTTGLASALATGTSSIIASLSGITGTTLLTVTPRPIPTLQSITVTPVNPSITVGATQQFVATGRFSDNTTENLIGLVTWESWTPSVFPISPMGLGRAMATGTSSITASLDGVTGATLLTVTPTPAPTPAPTPPIVTGISDVTHTRKGITRITVGFDEALDPFSAMHPAFYSLALGVKKHKSLVFSRNVRVGGVTYNGASNSVTIRLAVPTKGTIRVIVRGGIMAADGAVSAGNFTAVVS